MTWVDRVYIILALFGLILIEFLRYSRLLKEPYKVKLQRKFEAVSAHLHCPFIETLENKIRHAFIRAIVSMKTLDIVTRLIHFST